MTNNTTNDFTAMLKGLSPDEARGLLKRLKAEAIEAAAENRVRQESERVDPKKLKKYFKQFDDARLGELPLGPQRIREELIKVLGWKKGDGLCPLHFKDKPLGSQCTWSVIWLTKNNGTLHPRDYFPLERMSAIELLVEATDLCNQEYHYVGKHPDLSVVEREILPFVKLHEANEIVPLEVLREKIRGIRGSYVECICPWDPSPGPFYFPPAPRSSWDVHKKAEKELTT